MLTLHTPCAETIITTTTNYTNSHPEKNVSLLFYSEHWSVGCWDSDHLFMIDALKARRKKGIQKVKGTKEKGMWFKMKKLYGKMWGNNFLL